MAKETTTQRKRRLEKARRKYREKRMNETEEERLRRLQKRRLKLANITEEQRKVRNEYQRIHQMLKRAAETEEMAKTRREKARVQHLIRKAVLINSEHFNVLLQNMKSIVLCESTFMGQNDNSKAIKEIEENKNDEELEAAKLLNGKSEAVVYGEVDIKLLRNGDSNNCETEVTLDHEMSGENDVQKNMNFENSEETLSVADEGTKSVPIVTSVYTELLENSSSDICETVTAKNLENNASTETNCSVTSEKPKEENSEILNEQTNHEVIEIPDVPSSLGDVDLTNKDFGESEELAEKVLNETGDFSKKSLKEEVNFELNNDAKKETTEEKDSSQEIICLEDSFSMEDSDTRESLNREDIFEKENILDEDNLAAERDVAPELHENKEKEKNMDISMDVDGEDAGSSNDFSKCEIRLEESQAKPESENGSACIESDSKELTENLNVQLTSEDGNEGSEVVSASNQEYEREILNADIVKEESCQEVEEVANMEGEGNENEAMVLELPETERLLSGEVNVEERESEEIDAIETYSDKTIEDSEESNSLDRKRRMSNGDETELSSKKKKLSDDNGEAENDSVDDSSPSLVNRDTADGVSTDLTDVEKTKALPVVAADEKSKTSYSTEEETPQKPLEEKVATTSSFLNNLRGTLKSLTRSDLEELIIQKLCEVITERSTTGELRRKAQALEQEEERWKSKVQSLSKQMREMEMVMKKYMTEVQKQTKETNSQAITPLRVTRSVGLQVSFYSSANKLSKSNPPQNATPPSQPHNVYGRNAKQTPSKLSSPQVSVLSPNLRNKSSPPAQKSISLTPKPTVNQQKKSMTTRSDYTVTPQTRPVVPQSLLNNSRLTQNQVPGVRPNVKPAPVVQTTQQQLQQQQQQQKNGSKVIDLTEDDDRQPVKPPGPIRVVNHLPQTQVSQSNRFAYLLPTTSTAATGNSGAASRQVLIATPTIQPPSRQVMCSMPPLLFKGGNIVQTGPQPQLVNQNNRVIYPKVVRHPAPLPQTPPNQSNVPNLKLLPPRPALKISKVQTGIVLSWNMSLGPEHAPISSYQLYAYQESNSPPSTSLWKKVGDVKALPLPMACTLTQFMSGHKYHFAVRAVDLHSRIGPFSFPGTIVLVK